MKNVVVLLFLQMSFHALFAQTVEQDSLALEKLRAESGVDPTRIQSRVGYSVLIYDREESSGRIINRASLNLGVGRWNLASKYEVVSVLSGEPGAGFISGVGDIKFSVGNAFFVRERHALAAGGELSVPVAKPAFGTQYFSLAPSITYSYTINPTLFLAVQPQYTFALMKDPAFPDLNVVTIRSFIAKFTTSGYFFVFEPRLIFDLEDDQADLILSPIVGKALGGGFNLIALAEFPTRESTRASRGVLYQFGFNKNF